eukprot:scaffold519347_cov15-Prasinocladus_malaysianus.AAC.1
MLVLFHSNDVVLALVPIRVLVVVSGTRTLIYYRTVGGIDVEPRPRTSNGMVELLQSTFALFGRLLNVHLFTPGHVHRDG